MKEKKEETRESFQPFIPAGKVLPELTGTSIVTGIIMAVLFGAANAYLGLRVGMTVSASIPAAVISMGVLRVLLKRNSILENNIVQTIGSAGESVAAGAIFTMPALFMWSEEWQTAPPSFVEISLIAFCGGAMGILFMVPLRRALIVKEHHLLPYPEGTACAEVLLAGERQGSGAAAVFSGLGISAVYKFLADGIRLFPSKIHFELPFIRGAGIGADLLPALTGVGYICGPKISGYMMSGGILGWLCLMPLISLFGGGAILFPGDTPVGLMGSEELWRNYIRYIGAGAVAAGGIMSLVKALPLISRTFVHTVKDYTQEDSGGTGSRTGADLPTRLIGLGLLALIAIIWLAPAIPVTISGAVIIAVFGFFFAVVSSRLVGLVGSSNNPVSGMTIATLLIAALLLKLLGNTSHTGMIGAIAIGSVISIITAVAGDTSQDLKTGYLLGATPKKQQYGELIGITASSLAIGGVLYLLSKAWGFGSADLPAPQAILMKMVVEGVMGGNLPWVMVLSGAAIAAAVEILGVPVLPFAVGLYLPIHLTIGIMLGGLIRLYFEKRKNVSGKKRKSALDSGILYTSGLIAGEGIAGILLAVFAVIPFGKSSLGEFIDISGFFSLGFFGAILFFLLLVLSLFQRTIWQKENR